MAPHHKRKTQAAGIGLCAIGIGLSVFAAGRPWSATGLVVAATVALAGLLLLAYALAFRLTLSRYAIALRTLFDWQTASLQDVAGYTVLTSWPRDVLRLHVRPHPTHVDIPLWIELGEDMNSLLERLPNLAALPAMAPETARLARELAGDIARSGEHRRRTFNPGLKLGAAVACAGIVAGVLMDRLLQTSTMALMLIPVVHLLLQFHWTRRSPFDPNNLRDGADWLILTLFMCGSVLMLIALRATLEEWTSLTVPALVAGGVFACLAGLGTPRAWKASPLGVIAIMFFAACATAAANSAFDSAVPKYSATTVTGKRFTSGKSSAYYLAVSPAPAGMPYEYSVGERMYDEARPGMVVCVQQHPGLFDVPWFKLRPMASCPGLR